MDEQVEPSGGEDGGAGAVVAEPGAAAVPGSASTTRRLLLPVLLVLLVLAGGVLGWRVLSSRPTTERHRDPITAVRVTDDGRHLAITALPDGCFPDPGEPSAEVDGDRLVLSVVQTKEVPSGQKYCTLACPVGFDEIHTLEIDPDWAGLTMAAAPDDGHCSLSPSWPGPQRAGVLGTVPAVPDQ